jgi:glutamate-1-semialdehyde 2,1-aminomutase
VRVKGAMAIPRSQELYARAKELLPGGVNSPVRAFKSLGGEPIFMQRGKGARLWDEDGNEYIDYCMSWGPLILGHADDEVITAVTSAAAKGTSFGTPNRHEVEIAGAVTKRFPSMEKIRFVNSGTEATMSAIRLARGCTGKDRIIKCDGCYHGHADHLLVAGGSGLATFGTPDSAGVTAGNARDTLVIPYNDLKALEETLRRHDGTVAAFILEPVPCNYGLIIPDPGYLKGVRELCDRFGVMLIFDEVITGLRLAPGGAQEYYGVKADITTLGKIIGGGLPVGAYGASREIMGRVAPDGPVYQAGTLSGNPLAMAAGIATLRRLDSMDAYGTLRERAIKMKRALEPILERYRGRFLFLQLESIFAFYFSSGTSVRNLDEVKASDMKHFARFHGAMLKRGVYLSPSGYEVGFLSTAHGDGEIDTTAAAAAESLREILG